MRKLSPRDFKCLVQCRRLRDDTGVGICSSVSSAFFLFLFFFFLLFRAAYVAYGSSKARGPIWATGLSHSHRQQGRIPAASAEYTTAHGNSGYLTHWARLISSWTLVRFTTRWATTGTPSNSIFTKYVPRCHKTSESKITWSMFLKLNLKRMLRSQRR